MEGQSAGGDFAQALNIRQRAREQHAKLDNSNRLRNEANGRARLAESALAREQQLSSSRLAARREAETEANR